jgi:hypothetical protein
LFVEKVPVVTEDPLGADSAFPQPGVIACVVISRRHDPGGRELVTIDTERPWGVESKTGQARFEIEARELVDL